MQKNIDITKLPTPEQIAMLEAAALRKPCVDEECPEFSEEELKTFHRISAQKEDALNNAETIAAIKEVQELKKNPNKKAYDCFSKLLEDLDS